MLKTSDISSLVNQHLAGTDKFLTEVFIKPGNRIYVFIDGDSGVKVSDCIELSRFIESQLNREAEDFELNVSSAGADQPITMPRQYIKNIGRTLKITMNDDRMITGKLDAAGEKSITITTPGDKKKKLAPETISLPFEEIKESKVIISFK